MYYLGLAFSTVSVSGLGIFYLITTYVLDKEGWQIVSEFMDVLPYIAIIVLVGMVLLVTAIEGTVKGEGRFPGEERLNEIDFLNDNTIIKSPVINGAAIYIFGVVVFGLTLIYREITRSLSLSPTNIEGFIPTLIHQLFVLLVDFGYVGFLLISMGQIYIGYSILREDSE